MKDGATRLFIPLARGSRSIAMRFTSSKILDIGTFLLRTVPQMRSNDSISNVLVIRPIISTGKATHVRLVRPFCESGLLTSTGTNKWFDVNNLKRPEGYQKQQD